MYFQKLLKGSHAELRIFAHPPILSPLSSPPLLQEHAPVLVVHPSPVSSTTASSGASVATLIRGALEGGAPLHLREPPSKRNGGDVFAAGRPLKCFSLFFLAHLTARARALHAERIIRVFALLKSAPAHAV